MMTGSSATGHCLRTSGGHNRVDRRIPLFIEEMTNADLQATGVSPAQSDGGGNSDPPGTEMPSTLHASLMARRDRLGRAKEIAQIGAAIGDFSPSFAGRPA